MAVTRIKNNQITDLTVNAASKLVDYTVTAAKLANNLVYSSDLTVAGNLTVQGNTTTIDTTYTIIEDPIITLASNQTGSPTVDIGFIGERGTSNNIAFVWNEANSEFVTAYTSTLETNTVVTISSYADFHTNNANVGGNLSVGGNFSITGNIAGNVTFTGNLSAGNLLTSGQMSAGGNVTGGNVLTTGLISATGNITSAANIDGANVNATTGVTTSTLVASSTVSATGNITGGNLNTAGQVIATGNVTGGNLNATGLSLSGNVVSSLNVSGDIAAPNVSVTTLGNGQIAIGYTNGKLVGGPDLMWQFDNARIWTTGLDSNGNVTTSGAISATGNVTGGNIVTSGLVTATGNVNAGNVNAVNAVRAVTGYFTGNVDVLGNLNASIGIVYANSGIFYGDAVTGNNAAFAGVPGFTQLGSNVVMQFAGNVNSYSQLNFQNINSGNRASTDYIATADNGNDSAYYADFGINSSTFDDPVNYPGFFPNDSYVHNHGGNLILNPETAGKQIVFMVGGTDTTDVIATMSNTQLSVTGAISASGNITGNYFFGNGSQLTGVTAASANAETLTGTFLANNVVNSSLTSVGTLSNLSVAGNITTTANVAAGNVSLTGALNAATISSTGNLFVGGNLTVEGNVNYINVNDLRVEDPVIIMGTGPNGAPLTTNDGLDRGIFMEYYTTGRGNAFVGWDNSTGNMVVASDVNFTANDVVGVNSYGTLQAGNIYAQSVSSIGNITTTANIAAGNASVTGSFGAGSLSASGNVTGGNLISNGLITATGNVTTTANVNGGNVISTALVQGATVSASGNVIGGNVNTAGQVIATGNVSGGNVTTAGQVVATGNVSGGNLNTAGQAVVTGNVTGGNLNTGGQVVASGDISGNNLYGAGVVSATGNVTGGNVTTAGQVTATGNVTGGNLNTAGQAVVTGNITGGNVLTGGIVSATGNITSAANVAGGNLLTGGVVSATGNVTGGNLTTAGAVTATGNVTGGNVLTTGIVSATGDVTSAANVNGGNVIATTLVQGVTVSASGNVIGGNLTTAGQVSATSNITGGNILTGGIVSATGNITGGNVIATAGQFGNIVISGDDITDVGGGVVNINSAGADVNFAVNGDTLANIFFVDAGTGTASFGNSTQTTNAIVAFNATNSILMPVGNTAQRPSTGVVGMLRYNTITDSLEQYTSTGWEEVGTPAFTVISDQQFNGDGSTVAFTLNATQTTNGVIVSINGVLQIPTSAYSVSGTTLTFTEAPQSGDLIDVRALTTTTTVSGISNQSGNAKVDTSNSTNQVSITGNLVPVANATQSLGSPSLQWKDIYVAGNTIYLGTIQLKSSGNTLSLFAADGTTPATISSSSVDTTQIANGTSNVAVASSGGNIRMNVGGVSNVAVVYSGGMSITGDLAVTGNATLSGNILGDRVQNGTTSFDIQTTGGNANISVGGTTNVAVFATTGVFVSGLASVTGNITGGNLSVGTGTITVNNIVNGGANGVGNIGSSTTYFNTVFAKATSAQYADLAEMYSADAAYEPGTVLSFGGANEVTATVNANDARIAGVVSTNPSYIMNSALEAEHVVAIALTGRVPTRVLGPVAKGDMMVSAGGGRAQACATPAIGTVIGKALEDFNGAEGTIEVVVGRL